MTADRSTNATQDALEDCLVHHPDAHSHFRKLVVAQTAEKTIATAVRRMKLERLQEQRPDDPQIRTWQGESEREERQRQRGVEPPVVTRALARSRSELRPPFSQTCQSISRNDVSLEWKGVGIFRIGVRGRERYLSLPTLTASCICFM
jgi:hypothetical protein